MSAWCSGWSRYGAVALEVGAVGDDGEVPAGVVLADVVTEPVVDQLVDDAGEPGQSLGQGHDLFLGRVLVELEDHDMADRHGSSL